jgi:hypothetical protein
MFEEHLPSLPAHLGWLCGSLTERLEWVLEQVPSANTQAALEAMEATAKSTRERMLYAAAWERQLSATQARAMAAQVGATTPEANGPYANQEILDGELAGVLRRTDGSMAHALAFARRLRTALPVTFALLDSGDITLGHARAIEDLTETLDVDQAQTVDERVAERAATMTVNAFRRIVRQAVADIDADPRQRHERASRGSGARLYPEPDGMCTLAVRMPATDGVATLDALNRQADALKTEDDTRTHGQRQVQALFDGVFGTSEGSLDASGKPRARRRNDVRVTIDWASLLGLREHPAELEGFGPVPAALVRSMLDEPGTTLRRLVFDPESGVLRDFGRTRYTPDAHMRGLIEARDVTCRYPGCPRAAVWCDTEHCDAYDDGGPTSCANCGLMCRKHHNRKTHDGYTYRRVDPETGETIWTTPLGFTYRQMPATYSPTGTDTGDTIRFTAEEPPPKPEPPPPGDDPPF